MTKDDKELLNVYLLKSPPVNWVCWYTQLSEGEPKQALYKILFDKETDSLRDLTRSNIREEVLACVQKYRPIMKIVWTEINEAIDEIICNSQKDKVVK